ncbi:hypothetical protein [Tissierella sp. Yu-01]|uniref:hypothetical protein n=1 Tax=Tissierella sp. Yu-01 TaxID=3035694 RepID=UPI00240D262A|nr:hypothetical protein [Tissierella sp. Yu-01]WFA10358.1 hypothetical protein P3962_07340 [Tissierella sp. Yu-01]
MEDKRLKLEKEICTKISTTLDKLQNVESLDYFDIEIKVHRQNIDLRCTIKDRGKVY